MSKLAYVLGINEYVKWNRLKNPNNDANCISKTLEKIGFRVKCFYDLDNSDYLSVFMNLDTK